MAVKYDVPWTIRSSQEQIDAWKEAAHASRLSFSRWVRERLDAALTDEQHPLIEVRLAPIEKEKPIAMAAELLERAKSSVCDKRVAKGTFCKSCGRTH